MNESAKTKPLTLQQIKWQLASLEAANRWLTLNYKVADRVARIRAKMAIPMCKCPCDPFDENRGCIGSTCRRELIEQGTCYCRCFTRIWVSSEEAKALLDYYHLKEEDFKQHFQGRTVGMIDDKPYYYPWDICSFFEGRGIHLPYDEQTVIQARNIMANKK